MSVKTINSTSTGRSVHWMHSEGNLGEGAPSVTLNMFSWEEQDRERRYKRQGQFTLKEFKTELKHYQPEVLYWSFNACDRNQAKINPSTWKAVCATVGDESETLMTTPCPISNFYHSLIRAHATQVSREFCREMALLLRSLPNLGEVHLLHFSFPSTEDWMLVQQALRKRTMLEDFRFHNLKATSQQGSEYDISEYASADPCFLANRACAQYLRNERKASTSGASIKVSRRLQTHLYTQSNIEKAAAAMFNERTVLLRALPSIAYRLDFVYELLRHQEKQWTRK